MSLPQLFSAGDCPVCFDSGALVCLVSRDSGAIILFCPLCETAWPDRPKDGRVDTIYELAELAPAGVSLPTAEALASSSIGPVARLERQEWFDLLSEHIHPSH